MLPSLVCLYDCPDLNAPTFWSCPRVCPIVLLPLSLLSSCLQMLRHLFIAQPCCCAPSPPQAQPAGMCHLCRAPAATLLPNTCSPQSGLELDALQCALLPPSRCNLAGIKGLKRSWGPVSTLACHEV